METSAEAIAAVEHELEVSEAIRREILNECAEISEISTSYESLLSKVNHIYPEPQETLLIIQK